MVIDKQGYDDLILYLTDNLSLFERQGEVTKDAPTVMALIEDSISDHVMRFFQQHPELNTDDRGLIVREVDGIVYDLQEVLSSVANRPVTVEQKEFIDDFTGLVKNLFDAAVADFR